MSRLILLLLLICSTTAFAQSIQNFSLPSTNGKNTSLDQFASMTGVVVVFTSNECPFDNYYKDRMKEMISAYAGKVQFLLINSNVDDQETAEKMALHYSDLNVPYLADKDQTVMENFGARKTPEAFVLQSSGGKFSVTYSGAIDDNPQVAGAVKEAYLKAAIDKLVAGDKSVVPTVRAVGCTIKKK